MGTAVETAAVTWLRDNGCLDAERLALAGKDDKGDIRIWREPELVIAECKRAQLGVKLGPWMREVEVEVRNAGAAFGLLIAKQRGAGDRSVARWVAAMDFDQFMPRLLAYREILYRRMSVAPDFRVVMWSPTKINSEYVPLLAGAHTRTKAYLEAPTSEPFAVTYSPGHPETQYAVGPLGQFMTILHALRWNQR